MTKKGALAKSTAGVGEALSPPPEEAYPADAAPLLIAAGILPPDQTVRFHAANLRSAIGDARAAGYVVNLPFPLEALDRIAISETAKVGQ